MKLVTAQEMREIDRRAIEEFGIPGLVLMENAGGAVARTAECLWRERGSVGTLLVLCGPGNNGGDGLVVARHLHNRGLPVRALLFAAGESLRGDAASNFRLAQAFGVPLFERPRPQALTGHLAAAGLVVDALLGTGLTGPVRGEIAQVVERVNRSPVPVVAVDIPSGVNSETGAIMGVAVRADLTVTFGLPKVGLYCFPGRTCCGEIEVADISLPRSLLEDTSLQTELVTPESASAGLPPRLPDMHKANAGRLLIIAGSPGMTGAAALAANAAVRAGAGLVYLAIPEGLNAILEQKCTEPITLPQAQTAQGAFSAQAADLLLAQAAGCHAVVLGPGLGRHPETAALVQRLIARVKQPLVVDADALNALSGRAELLAARRAPTVITPHPGELSRLLGVPVEAIQADRLSAARRAASDLNCTTILKGAGTVCAVPEGRAYLNPTGNHGLASGGTGDVLAGMLGAFLAGGSAPLGAALSAVYYHGRAADLYAEELAARSLAAGDLLDYLPRALREAEAP